MSTGKPHIGTCFVRRAAVGGEWLFLHFDEVLEGRSIPILEERLGAYLDREMLRADLSRSTYAGSVVSSAEELYQQLIQLSMLKYSPS